MKTLLACSRALLLLVLAPALLGETRLFGERGPRPETSRPLEELRDVVEIVTSEAGIDIYWVHLNELVEPVRPTLYRTRVSLDGRSREVTRIYTFAEFVYRVEVGGAGSNVQVLWTGDSGTRVSPIDGDTLKYPEGKQLRYGESPGITCHETECAVVYDLSGMQMAAILDTDSNIVSGPFPLPEGFHPIRIVFDERGIFFLRHDLNSLRAALVTRYGAVQFDVWIAYASTRSFQAADAGVTTRGSEYVVAFANYAATPDELQTVTVSADGRVSTPKRLMQVEERPDLPSNFSGASLAWNGSRFLIGGYYVIGRPFLMLLDPSLQPAGPLFRGNLIPILHPHPDGSSFVIVWHSRMPAVTILRADGSMTAPLSIVPAPRRRAVR